MKTQAPLIAVALLLLSGGTRASEHAQDVELIVSGPPVTVKDAEVSPLVYTEPKVPPGLPEGAGTMGIVAQGWSMLGREDISAKIGSAEYQARPCEAIDGGASGSSAVLDGIVRQARDMRVVIINESHEVTLHRDFSRQIIERLQPLGFTVLAAETFANQNDRPDPVEISAEIGYPLAGDGYYLGEPAFGNLVRSAKRMGMRLAAYEIVHDPERERSSDFELEIALRESAQAENLQALLESMEPHEKLIVHVGYSHAREIETKRADGFDTTWMAGRLKRMTGIDPLTIAQTVCRGSSDVVQFSKAPERETGWFDLIVDHPTATFRHGRAAWRFEAGQMPVAIPEEYSNHNGPLIIEAFAEGEPFDAVPMDRVWVEPGEDIRLALKPGRYVVRAIIPKSD